MRSQSAALASILGRALTVVEIDRLYEYVAGGGEFCCGHAAWKYRDDKSLSIEVVASGYLPPLDGTFPELWHELVARLAVMSGPSRFPGRARAGIVGRALSRYMQLIETSSRDELKRAVLIAHRRRWRGR